MNHDVPRIQDGPGFGCLLRSARLDKGLSETELARAMDQAYPDSATTHSWIVWAEAGRLASIDFAHVVGAAMALNVPVSSLVPAPSPPHDPDQRPTLRAQLRLMGLSDADIEALPLGKRLDNPGTVWPCGMTDLWEW